MKLPGVRLTPDPRRRGASLVWELKSEGRVRVVDGATLRAELKSKRLTGIELVRRRDGDWGPLFGRPAYREVFSRVEEPRDQAKQAARDRIFARQRQSRVAAVVALCCVLGSGLTVGTPLSQGLLIGALCLGLAAGLRRLQAQLLTQDLESLSDRLLPPVTSPPPVPEDWALRAAEDEVAALLSSVETSE